MKEHKLFGHTLYDKLVFSKIKMVLGGNVKYLFSGGAPLNKDVMDFFKIAIAPCFVEAYGQTEGSGAEYMTFGYETTSGTVGVVNTPYEFKLVDVP